MFACCWQSPTDVAGDAEEEETLITYEVPSGMEPYQAKLQGILEEKPYLKGGKHILENYIKNIKVAIRRGDKDMAQDALDTLTMELDAEKNIIGAAFMKFDSSGDGVLSGEELQFMLDYLGFPCEPTHIKELLAAIDNDSDGTISFSEFLDYVGGLGGSAKLFEVRRKQIEDRGDFKASVHDKDTRRFLLTEAGIHEDAQAYWQLVASPSELDSAACMEACQQQAVRHIRNLAKENHERALPKLSARVKGLGFSDTELYMALAWIRELAPIIVHINLDKIGNFLQKDTHYRNQFETNSSGGLLKFSAREKWEAGLFGTSYKAAKPFDRPKYGVQNIWNDYKGVQGCVQYGDSYLILKDVRLRMTLSPEDSANLKATRLAVPDYYAHVLQEYSDKELTETLRVAQGGDEKLGDSKAVIEKWGKYKEAQIHGEVSLKKHVSRLVVNERHRKQNDWVKGIADTHGWTLTWMDDFKKELESKAGGREMDQEKFREHLAKFQKEEEQAEKAKKWVRMASFAPSSFCWEFSIKDGWKAFDSKCQDPLEEQWKAFKSKGEPAVGTIKSRDMTILVDFKNMTQSVEGGTGRARKVQRREIQ